MIATTGVLMLTLHRLAALVPAVLLLPVLACGNVERSGAGEEELVNQVTLTLEPEAGGDPVSATITDDLNGTVTQDHALLLLPGAYRGSITLTNTTVEPPVDITQEVIAEADEHRFFYTIVPEAAGLAVSDLDLDGNGIVFGQQFRLVVAANFSAGGINVVLTHFDEMPKGDGSVPSNETDVDVTFSAMAVP